MTVARYDLSGQRFGMLTVVQQDHERSANRTVWECRCDCGKTTLSTGWNLKRNRGFISCGCKQGVGSHAASREGQIGKKYNRLTILEFTESRLQKRRVKCRCDCGNIIECFLTALKRGNTGSCGCYAAEKQSKSGSQTCDSNQRRSGVRNWTYMGVRYRSGLEVMYAAYLTRTGIRFVYEPRRFTLDEKTSYKPDFYLIDEAKWVEVKGHLSPSAKKKAKLFGRDHNYAMLRLKQVEAKYGATYSSFIYWWDKGVRPE